MAARGGGRAHAPREDELLGVGGQLLAERLPQVVGQLEDALDPRLRRVRAHDARLGPAAEQEVERVGEHGLARARLPREDVQAWAEAQLGPLDQQEVLDAQLVEHGRRSTSRPTDRRAAPLPSTKS